jgi:hypothetical protein
MAGLLDWLSQQKDSAMSDYAGLMDNYPNAQKFGNGLINNISQHIPSNEDFHSPHKMGERSMEMAMNAPMGLTSLSNSAMNKIIKALESSNKSTAPKIPTGNVFNNSLGEIPLETRIKADDYFSNSNHPQPINISDIIPTQKNITLNNLKGVNNIEEPVNAVMINGKYYLTDGHHRVSLANLNNETNILGKVFNANTQ